MPVPVPHIPAHPVIKADHPGFVDRHTAPVLQHLSHNLPLQMKGQASAPEDKSSALRERPKPYRIWEEDSGRPVHRENRSYDNRRAVALYDAPKTASSISLPPLSSSHPSVPPGIPLSYLSDEDDGMDSDGSAYAEGWCSPGRPSAYPGHCGTEHPELYAGETCDYEMYRSGGFSPDCGTPPGLEGCGGGPESSPVGPVTPFGEFVDRAVAAPVVLNDGYWVNGRPASYHRDQDYYGPQYDCPPHGSYPCDGAHAEAPSAPLSASLSPELTYKKLVDPLAEWVATYAWKVCTTGMNLSPSYVADDRYGQLAPRPTPSHLTTMVRSLLLSTLLQPAAVFLSLWYVVRLPVFFGPVGFGAEHTRELLFRDELLENPINGSDAATAELQATYRAIVLGFMFANKWLDDHTFSNKTWHAVSNIPQKPLNRLEFLALDLFRHDLSIAPGAWMAWLSHVKDYHGSTASVVGHPQPIARPSNNPHVIVRKAIEELIQTPPTARCGDNQCGRGPPEPIFIGLDERRRAKMEQEDAQANLEDIDLDEDGPLRKEYLPRRRDSGRSVRSCTSETTQAAGHWESHRRRSLPPPAKWSPGADEPLSRSRPGGAQYMAHVPLYTSIGSILPPPQPTQYQPWPSNAVYAPFYGYEHPPFYHAPSYNQPADVCHAESAVRLPAPPMASYPPCPAEVPQLHYGYSDMRMTARDPEALPKECRWTSSAPAPYGPSYGPAYNAPAGYQPLWVRA